MKKNILILFSVVAVFLLCSFASPAEVNIYSGTLSGSGRYNGYHIQYYVNDTSHLSRDQNGVLINTDRYTVSGRCLINNAEFDINFPSNCSITIFDNNIGSNYNLIVDISPSHFILPIWILYIIVLSVFIVLLFVILRGILQ